MSPVRRARVERQPLMPESAANPASAAPARRPTAPRPWRLYDGHLTAECSIRRNGGPACPACLALDLRERYESLDQPEVSAPTDHLRPS